MLGVLALLLGLGEGAAADRCSPAPVPVQAAPASDARRQFDRLIAADRYLHVPEAIEAWRGLMPRLRAEASATVPLALARLAWSLEYVGRIEEAKPFAAEATTLAEAGVLPPETAAEVFATRSMVEVDAGDTDAADAHARRALDLIARAAPVSGAAAFAHNAVANVAYARGRYADAERDYARATDLDVRCLAPDRSIVVNDMASHAGVLYMVGRTEEALAQNERAATWALEHLDEASPVVTLALGNQA